MKRTVSTRTDEQAPGGHGSPFGARLAASQPHHAPTIPDAVRRCRWIGMDLDAVAFAVFFAAPSAQGPDLVACFDSAFPSDGGVASPMTGEAGRHLAGHALSSSLPCWWNDGPECGSSLAFERLDWCARLSPPLSGCCGIAFPVQAERGRCGLVAFLGQDMVLDAPALYDLHARCFTLFEAVARLRPDASASFPQISKRELQCLKLAANGCTSEDIARLLKLSVHTANQYLSNTVQKLDAGNRMHAVAKALRSGLIQ